MATVVDVLFVVFRLAVHIGAIRRAAASLATVASLCEAQKELIRLSLLLGGGACVLDPVLEAIIVFDVLLGVHDLR